MDDEYKHSDVMLRNIHQLELDSSSAILELSDSACQELKIDECDDANASNDRELAPSGGDSKADSIALPRVALQAEDYGGSIALPHYGYRRPSADYFNSNLMCYNFVLSDITGNFNNV